MTNSPEIYQEQLPWREECRRQMANDAESLANDIARDLYGKVSDAWSHATTEGKVAIVIGGIVVVVALGAVTCYMAG